MRHVTTALATALAFTSPSADAQSDVFDYLQSFYDAAITLNESIAIETTIYRFDQAFEGFGTLTGVDHAGDPVTLQVLEYQVVPHDGWALADDVRNDLDALGSSFGMIGGLVTTVHGTADVMLTYHASDIGTAAVLSGATVSTAETWSQLGISASDLAPTRIPPAPAADSAVPWPDPYTYSGKCWVRPGFNECTPWQLILGSPPVPCGFDLPAGTPPKTFYTYCPNPTNEFVDLTCIQFWFSDYYANRSNVELVAQDQLGDILDECRECQQELIDQWCATVDAVIGLGEGIIDDYTEAFWVTLNQNAAISLMDGPSPADAAQVANSLASHYRLLEEFAATMVAEMMIVIQTPLFMNHIDKLNDCHTAWANASAAVQAGVTLQMNVLHDNLTLALAGCCGRCPGDPTGEGDPPANVVVTNIEQGLLGDGWEQVLALDPTLPHCITIIPFTIN